MRFFYVLLILLVFNSLHAQEFEQSLGNDDNVDMVLVTKDMFNLITEIDAENKNELKDFYGSLEYLATYSADRSPAANKIYDEALAYVRSKNMRLLTKIKDQNKTAEFYYLPAARKGYAKELVLVIRYANGHTSLMQVKGNINMRKISLLALQATMLDASLLKKAEQSVQ